MTGTSDSAPEVDVPQVVLDGERLRALGPVEPALALLPLRRRGPIFPVSALGTLRLLGAARRPRRSAPFGAATFSTAAGWKKQWTDGTSHIVSKRSRIGSICSAQRRISSS